MLKFILDNIKNENINLIIFKLNYDNFLEIWHKKDFYSYFKSKLKDK